MGKAFDVAALLIGENNRMRVRGKKNREKDKKRNKRKKERKK